MRRAGLYAGVLGVLLQAPLIGSPRAIADTTVDYRGLRITVPAGWPVHRLGRDSAECLRFDRHALYLGPAGHDQLCPAHAVGRTEALHVEPLTAQAAALASGLLDGRTSLAGMPALTVRDAATGEIRTAVPAAGVLITGSYGTGRKELERVLGEITAVPPHEAERMSGGRRWVAGAGFDTCTAPSLAAMRAWRADFVAANVYIGGPARACPDGRLSRRWVAAVQAMGWRLIPTYVGPQAPCAAARPRFSPATAVLAGRLSAADAVNRAMSLGLAPKTPIYLDLEPYKRHRPGCRDAVLAFLDAWTRAVRAMAFTPGVYGSVRSGIRDLGGAEGISKPTAIWFAHWDRRPDVWGDRYVDDEWWPGHHRIKQFRGDHVEKHGGVRLKIDSDSVDGNVG